MIIHKLKFKIILIGGVLRVYVLWWQEQARRKIETILTTDSVRRLHNPLDFVYPNHYLVLDMDLLD